MIVQKPQPVTLIGGAPVSGAVLRMALAIAPEVVAADGGAETALAAGLTPEAVIGDFDSITDAARTALPAQVLHHVAEQDSTDFEKCLSRIETPLIVGAGFIGARVDHQLAACTALVHFAARRCILLGEDDAMFLAPPDLALDLGLGRRFSLFPMGAVRGRSDGLKWPIDGLDLAPDGRIGTSNQTTGPVRLRAEAPRLLVIVPRDAAPAAARALVRAPGWDPRG